MNSSKVLSFVIPSQRKHREHKVLFDTDTPFLPKKVGRKDMYKRKPKFVGREENWQ